MGQFDNETFGFNDELEQSQDFNYESINGLGLSDYENEDLFNNEVENDISNDFRIGLFDSNEYYEDEIKGEELFGLTEEDFQIEDIQSDEVFVEEPTSVVEEETEDVQSYEVFVEEPTSVVEEETEDVQSDEVFVEEPISIVEESTPAVEEPTEEKVVLSETPIEELNKLTEYKEEKIEGTDINSLFDRISVNVQDASEIFKKNADLKEKIDARFEELKKLQNEIENARKKQIDEVNSYKEEVLSKLTEKKEEIEKRLNLLKDTQATFEKEKKEFEEYRIKTQAQIDKVQKEVQSAYDDRREELSHIEDVLRKQKDALDEERGKLSLDRIQYESDKNELANNLLKFNELVSTFKTGVGEIKE